MTKRVGDSVYHTTTWRRLRQSYYDSKYGLCERCSQPGDVVHHTVPITIDNVDDPDVTFNADRLELLCHTCHNIEHKGGSSVRDDVMFNDDGQVIKK